MVIKGEKHQINEINKCGISYWDVFIVLQDQNDRNALKCCARSCGRKHTKKKSDGLYNHSTLLTMAQVNSHRSYMNNKESLHIIHCITGQCFSTRQLTVLQLWTDSSV